MGGKLVVGDCVEAMARLPAECADLIFADPPFNIGYEYDIYDDRRSRDRHPKAKPCGRVPDDVWILRPQETAEHFRPEHDVWFVPRVCGTSFERVAHPCQMPEAILERIIRVATNSGDLVVDPFAGSGTTLAVAKRLGRCFWGCELSPRYANVIVERLRGLLGDEIEVEYLRPQREVIALRAESS